MKIRITKASLKDHFHYYALAYIGVIVATSLVLNLIVTSIKSQAPAEKTLSLYVCGELVTPSSYYSFRTDLEKAFDDMELINTDNLAYKSSHNLTGTYRQKFAAMLASDEGDLLILPYEDFTDLVYMNAFQALDDFLPEYIEQLDALSLKTVTMKYNTDEPKVYAIPLDGHKLFALDEVFQMEDKVLVLLNRSRNTENAVRMAKWILDRSV